MTSMMMKFSVLHAMLIVVFNIFLFFYFFYSHKANSESHIDQDDCVIMASMMMEIMLIVVFASFILLLYSHTSNSESHVDQG